MLDVSNINYNVSKDLDFILHAEEKTEDELIKELNISRATYYEIMNGIIPKDMVCESIYSYIYNRGYRLHSVKEELLKETNKDLILFHGSKNGLTTITEKGSQNTSDFSHGFYLSERYEHALSFVCKYEYSSIYSFRCNLNGLNVIKLDCSLDWMLLICYFRGTIQEYNNSKTIQNLTKKIKDADLIVAPIADNRMFMIMNSFASGDISVDTAMHSLAASSLGLQYVFKTKKALNKLIPIEKYYLCNEEKQDQANRIKERVKEVDTKLKMAKREFRKGLFIDEVIK